MNDLEDRLRLSEQEVIALNREASKISAQFQEAKDKWSEVQNIVLAVTDR